MKTIDELSSPAVLIEADALAANLRRMQSLCAAHDVELWPHIKTHKLVPVLRRQLAAGAIGATCAKIGEAEAMLPSGVKRIFIAHSLADLRKAPRLKALQDRLEQLILAVTSEPQYEALEAVLAEAKIKVPVLMAADTGLDREGARSPAAAADLAKKIRSSSRMELIGLYTHEGHAYMNAKSSGDVTRLAKSVLEKLKGCARVMGGDLSLWPGCSVTAAALAQLPGVKAVRPGAYIFGDLYLSEVTKVMSFEEVALSVLATVVDRPLSGMALIDAGSKVFSSDKVDGRLTARALNPRSLEVIRLSEEHGFLNGHGVDDLKLGQRLRFQPAHVCPVVNLAREVHLVRGEEVLESWPVDARGRSD